MKITEINIALVKPNKGLIGFASFVINSNFYMGCVGIFARPEGGIRLVYPKKDGLDCFHPLSRSVAEPITLAVQAKLQEFTNIFS